MQGTASNIYSDTIRFTVGTANAATNLLRLVSYSYFNTSSGLVTNGFYDGKTFDLNPLVTYAPTNKGGYFEARLGLATELASGTGDVVQLTFECLGGTNYAVVPVNIFVVQVGRAGGTWQTGNGTWSGVSPDYGNSSYAYIVIQERSPTVTISLVGGAQVSLTLSALKSGTVYSVQTCTNLVGGSWTNIASFTATNTTHVLTNEITNPQQQFWRIAW